MYAIVEIAGQQFKIEQDQRIFVHRLEAKEGSQVNFDKVLLMDNAGKVNVGAPVIKGAKVTAKVLEHLKGDKVIVFKKKRRKGYRVKNGHRQYLTKLEILKIDEKASVEKKAKPKTQAKPAAKKPAVKKPAAKKPAAKKPAAKKPAAKKASVKKPVAKKASVKKTVAKKPE
ncbi:MAG: 50S ribosomal protein L21 [Bacteroidota bacterium]|nr:50S ribosomal protein L21 [Bacteroidota bacterium]